MLSLFLSLSVCRRSSLLTVDGEVEGGGEELGPLEIIQYRYHLLTRYRSCFQMLAEYRILLGTFKKPVRVKTKRFFFIMRCYALKLFRDVVQYLEPA
jgi:hypothetical protein